MSAPGRVLALVTAAQVLNVASATVVAVALPELSADLGASRTEQQWVVDAFVLVFASLLIAGGVLGDRFGRRRALLVGLVMFGAGSLLCVVASSSGWLIFGRVIQGLGPPLTVPATLALLTSAYTDPVARAKAIGVWGAGSGFGLAIGPLAGGLVVDGLGWRWVFGVNLPLVVALVVLALVMIPRDEPGPRDAPLDVLAGLLLTAAVGLLVFGLIEGRELGWGSGAVLGVFAGAAVSLVAFVRRELRHPAPLVDLALLRRRAFLGANIGGATLYGALTGSIVYVVIFLQEVQDRSAAEAGLVLLPQGILTAALAPVGGRMTARYGPRPPVLLGMGVSTVAFLALLRLEADTPLAEAWLAFGLLGVGVGLALPPMTATALSAVEAAQAGMASAIHNASRQLGQTFAVAVLGTILFAKAGEETGAAGLVDGLHAVVLVCAAAVAVVGVGLAVLLPRRARAGQA